MIKDNTEILKIWYLKPEGVKYSFRWYFDLIHVLRKVQGFLFNSTSLFILVTMSATQASWFFMPAKLKLTGVNNRIRLHVLPF